MGFDLSTLQKGMRHHGQVSIFRADVDAINRHFRSVAKGSVGYEVHDLHIADSLMTFARTFYHGRDTDLLDLLLSPDYQKKTVKGTLKHILSEQTTFAVLENDRYIWMDR